ncbi:winged helix DNA-binding domain-containing protein [Actinomadura craniellae]|uniref:Winged helix DNA-binding domain-containing protein n=1 Tax=Actinomadura craniellae TaxID=2231787 RepID=A0A365HBY8_9ACTN|nr:winged helix DNA-binding domain-containing protein [Actinomadura craniellae]
MRTFDAAERRARLAVRHGLAAGFDRPEDAAEALLALHATDPASVFLAAAARLRPPGAVPAVERALYANRTLVRMLGMRRTVFVVPVGLVPSVQAGCTDAVAVRLRTRLVQLLGTTAVGPDPGGWLREVEESVHRALLARGEATGAELSTDEPRLRVQLHPPPDKAYARPQNITSLVIGLMAAEGLIVRGRPLGSWTSSQYRWAPVEAWLPGGAPALDAQAARTGLARRWLAAYGPATVADLRWWTGWTAGETKRALAGLETAEVGLDDGAAGLVLADDLEPVPAPEPRAALLPALDPTAMGWAGRDWYLGEHGPALFDRTGNIGPTVWWDGRIIGGWAQRADGEIAVRLLADAGAEATAAVDIAAGRLRAELGDVRVTPRFRTPLERDLSG